MLNRFALTICAVLLLAPLSKATAESVVITGAHPDAAAHVLVIDGTGFRAGLHVGIGGSDLGVLSVNAHQVRTSLPALASGSYLLVLRQRSEEHTSELQS